MVKQGVPEEEEFEDEGAVDKKEDESVSLAEPMTLWVTLLALALIIKLALSFSNAFSSIRLAPNLGTLANYVLFPPGTIILSIIVGALIGVRVGQAVVKKENALKKGFLNGIYAATVYMLAIVIIYIILVFSMPSSAPSIQYVSTQLLAVPVAIVVILSVIFSILTYSRR